LKVQSIILELSRVARFQYTTWHLATPKQSPKHTTTFIVSYALPYLSYQIPLSDGMSFNVSCSLFSSVVTFLFKQNSLLGVVSALWALSLFVLANKQSDIKLDVYGTKATPQGLLFLEGLPCPCSFLAHKAGRKEQERKGMYGTWHLSGGLIRGLYSN